MDLAFNYFLYPPLVSIPTNLLNLDKKDLSPSVDLDTECANKMNIGAAIKTTINVIIINSSLISIIKSNIFLNILNSIYKQY